jgi:transglutaminase-like putative cysteine protease
VSDGSPVSGSASASAEAGRREDDLLLPAELALTAISAAAVLGLARLFTDGSFLLPVMAFALGAHAVAAGCRRRGLGGWTTYGVAAVTLVAGVSWLLLGHTTAYGAPTGTTLAEVGRRLSDAWDTFTDVTAPAPVEPGFVLAAAVAVWLVAFAADGAAFRAGAVIEAAVPGAALFVFGAALGSDRQRLGTTAVFLAAVLAYWLTQRSLLQARHPTWMASDNRMGSRSLLRAGTRLGLAGVAIALVLGPALPGAGARAVIPWRASDREGGGRVAVSPLVDIRARIVDQASVEVFSVRSPERGYWRLTSLETFDGRIWRSASSFRDAEGELEAADPASRVVEQQFTIDALEAIWLPAAFRPVEVRDVDASYDADSATLITRAATSDGQRYAVRSAVPALTEEQLAAITDVGDVDSTYLDLPDGMSERVRRWASQITEGARTPYEKARALQDHFRGPTYTYDTSVQPGHGDDDLEEFLFRGRRGYCEQFAGAYAALARAVGLPARVAVGFTPGEVGDDGRYHVRGSNGHAWPEVHLADVGWVPFEPTPGRGIPGAEPYTGVAFDQAGPDGATTTTAPTTTTTAPEGTGPVAPVPLPFETGGAPATADPSPWPRRLAVGVAVLVAAVVAWALAVAGVARLRRSRRRARARTPEARVLLAWEEVGEAMARSGTPVAVAETPVEYARRAAAREPDVDAALLARLADATTAAGYAPDGIDPEVAEDAVVAAGALEEAAQGRLGRPARLRWAFDPRPLLPRPASRFDIRDEVGAPS